MIYEKTRFATFLSSFINFNFSLFAASVAATLFVLRLSKPKPNNISELSGNEKFFSSESVLFFSQLQNQYRKLPMKKDIERFVEERKNVELLLVTYLAYSSPFVPSAAMQWLTFP